jgi:hypothetical protein
MQLRSLFQEPNEPPFVIPHFREFFLKRQIHITYAHHSEHKHYCREAICSSHY